MVHLKCHFLTSAIEWKTHKRSHNYLTNQLLEAEFLLTSWGCLSCSRNVQSFTELKASLPSSLLPILSHIHPVHTLISCLFNIHTIPRSSRWSDFSTKILDFPLSCYMPCIFHSYSFCCLNSIWQRVQIMNLLVMQISPSSFFSFHVLK
jgi:hypothetical protein